MDLLVSSLESYKKFSRIVVNQIEHFTVDMHYLIQAYHFFPKTHNDQENIKENSISRDCMTSSYPAYKKILGCQISLYYQAFIGNKNIIQDLHTLNKFILGFSDDLPQYRP